MNGEVKLQSRMNPNIKIKESFYITGFIQCTLCSEVLVNLQMCELFHMYMTY